MHVSIKAESLQQFLGFPITNSIFATFVLLLLFAIFILLFRTIRLKELPDSFQNFVEFIIESLDSLTNSIAVEKGRVFLPIVASFFIFVLLSNWMGLLPGFSSIGFRESETVLEKQIAAATSEQNIIPLFRGPTADLNTTIALGFLSFILIQYYGVKFLNLSYFKKFINLKGPIDFFVGVLEIISDISKIISFAFRLFGNIFAGEVLLTVISFLTSGLMVLPFLGLEVFVGFVQALVFAMLTLVFMNIATQQHG